MNGPSKVFEALAVAFGTPLIPAWMVSSFAARLEREHLVFACPCCNVVHEFPAGRELTIVQQLRLQNHKTLHDLDFNALVGPSR